MASCWAVIFLGLLRLSDGSLSREKQTTQGSTVSNFYSNKAVDGRYVGLSEPGSCAHVADTDPWWAVDLQAVYFITKITIFNGNDQEQFNKTDNLAVEAFTGDPYLCPASGSLCGHNPGPSGQTVTIDCPENMLARYIKLEGDPRMMLCEVDVFGNAVSRCDLEKRTFEKIAGKRIKAHIVIQLGTTKTPLDCVVLCHNQLDHCSAVNYNIMDSTCTTPKKPIKNSFFLDNGDWNLYYAC